MLIYYFILIVCFIAAISIKNKIGRDNIYYFLVTVLIFLGAFRGLDVGTDLHGSYFENYNYISKNPETWGLSSEMEPAFLYFMAFLKTKILNSYEFFYALVFFLFMFGIHITIKRYSLNPILSLFFFVLTLHYTMAFNIMRQTLALSFVMMTLPLLRNRNITKIVVFEVLVLLIAIGWHRSCIVFLFLPVFISDRFCVFFRNNKKLVASCLICSYFFVFFSSFLYKYIDNYILLLSFLGDRYTGYVGASQNAEQTYSVFSAFLQTFLAAFVLYVTPQKKSGNLFLILYILGNIMCNVLGSMSALFLRIGSNFTFFDMFVYTDNWYNAKKSYRAMYRIAVVVLGLIVFTNSMIKNFGRVIPYNNWLFY